jgi:hypothetical protein
VANGKKIVNMTVTGVTPMGTPGIMITARVM